MDEARAARTLIPTFDARPLSGGRAVDGIFTTRFVDPYLRFHKYIYERSDGRFGKHSNRVPALLLTTTGRKIGAGPDQRPDLLPRPGRPHRGGLQRGE